MDMKIMVELKKYYVSKYALGDRLRNLGNERSCLLILSLPIPGRLYITYYVL